MRRTVFIQTCILIFSLQVFSQAESWKKCKTCNEPVIFYKELSTGKDFQIKAAFTVNYPIEDVIRNLQDIPSYKDWVYNCRSAVKISDESKYSGIYRSIIGAPWPFKDNEVFMQYYFKEQDNGKSWKLYQKCLPDYAPLNDKYERITRFKAVWEITAVTENTTSVVYFAETGGPKNMSQPVKMLFLCSAQYKTVKEFIKHTGTISF